jgi:hypothetical protein
LLESFAIATQTQIEGEPDGKKVFPEARTGKIIIVKLKKYLTSVTRPMNSLTATSDQDSSDLISNSHAADESGG